MTLSEKIICLRTFSDLHFKETRLSNISNKDSLKNNNNKKNQVVKWAVKLWLQTSCFLAKLESLACKRQVEVQQRYLQKLLKNRKKQSNK